MIAMHQDGRIARCRVFAPISYWKYCFKGLLTWIKPINKTPCALACQLQDTSLNRDARKHHYRGRQLNATASSSYSLGL